MASVKLIASQARAIFQYKNTRIKVLKCCTNISSSSSSSSSSSVGLQVATAPDVLQPCGLLYYP